MHKEVGEVFRYVTLTVKVKHTSYRLQYLDAFEHISSFVYVFIKLNVIIGQNTKAIDTSYKK